MAERLDDMAQSGSPSDRELIEEATELLRQLRFSTTRGAYAEGAHVATSVDPRWDRKSQKMWVILSCYARGHSSVNWMGLPVFVEQGASGKLLQYCQLDRRGQGVIQGLADGEYALSSSPRHGRTMIPVVAPETADSAIPRRRTASQPVNKDGGEEVVAWSPLGVYGSVDGHVRVSVQSLPSGLTKLIFETDEAACASANVRFGFARRSGAVEAAGDLAFVRVERSLWEGRWEGRVVADEPCELVFELVSTGGLEISGAGAQISIDQQEEPLLVRSRLVALERAAETANADLLPRIRGWLRRMRDGVGPGPDWQLAHATRGTDEPAVTEQPIRFQQAGAAVSVVVTAAAAPEGGIAVLVPHGEAKPLTWDAQAATWTVEFHGIAERIDDVIVVADGADE